MGRELRARKAQLQGKLRESVAAGVRKIDGADEGNRDQQQDSGEEGIDDHINLPENSLLGCMRGTRVTLFVFNRIQVQRYEKKSQKRTTVGASLRHPRTGTSGVN